jgi:MFS family permease
MHSRTRSLTILFSTVVILLTGHGLQLTLLPLRAEGLGWSVTEIGMTGSFYFLGFLLGCIFVPRFVSGVGHIRVFSTMTTINGAALLCIVFSDDPWVWSFLRLLTGVGISGAYLIIESWINEQTTEKNRGQLLAIYTMLVLLSMSVGQLMINFGNPTGVTTLVMGSLLLSLSVIPVSLSRVHQPAPLSNIEFKFREIFAASPAAVGGAFAIGTVTGVLFTLTPVFGSYAGLPVSSIAWLMIAMVLGGATLQLPAGRLSDHYDRRIVMIGLLTIGLIVALAGLLLWQSYSWVLFVVIFLLGGCLNTIYPLSLAHANDRSPGHFLQVGTVILLVNSVGAIMGPTLGAKAMEMFAANGFLVYAMAGMAVTLAWITGCYFRQRSTPEHDSDFVGTAKSTQALIELDPRSNPDDEQPSD